ncbi:MAG: LacI family DNA-binding transcriptional regulator [Dermatophilaceae bacterium]
MTLQTIADRVGVSRMTVSNAFSRPDQLSAELRERVLAAADELGYTGPDPAARALARGSSGAVGVLLFDSLRVAFTDEVAIAMLGAVSEALAPTGRALTLLTSTNTSGPIPARDVALDGAVVYSCDQDSPGTTWLVKRQLPLVLVDQDHRPGYPHVNIDDRGGARAAAQHILDLGHERVGLVSYSVQGPPGPVTDVGALSTGHVSRERVAGWMDVLGPAGVEVRATQHTSRSTDGAETVSALFDHGEPPTALLCYSDAAASGVVSALSDRGLLVPDDVSVVGFDDSPLATTMRPQLTTVRQDVAAKGRAAVAALMAQLDGMPPPADVVLPVELVIRDSTAPPGDSAASPGRRRRTSQRRSTPPPS